MSQRLLLAGWVSLAAALGCSSSSSGGLTPASAPLDPGSPRAAKPGDPTWGATAPVLVIEAGKEKQTVCDTRLPASATVVDLRDAWTPDLFAVQPDGSAPDFRATYLALALEQDVDGKPLPPATALSELYGVTPSLAIVRDRFTETARYACHAKIDSAPMAKIGRPYGQELEALVRFNNHQRELLGQILERARVQRNLPDFAGLETDKELGPTYTRWKGYDDLYQGIVTAQRHLVCEGSLADKDVDGEFSWGLGTALEQFQRRNFLIPNGRLDP